MDNTQDMDRPEGDGLASGIGLSPASRRRGRMIFCPQLYCKSDVTQIDVQALKRSGINAVLLDLDNTLTEWQNHQIPQNILDWIEGLKSAGIKLCLVSNTRFGKRLKSVSEELKIPFVRRAFKPRKKGFQNAMIELGSSPANTVMIGDQMFTDVLGANRVGIYTIMVKPLGRREFFGTKISRAFELIFLYFYRRGGHI